MTIKAIFLFKSSYGNEYIATNNSYQSPQCDEPHGQETCTNCGYAWALCDEVEDAHVWHCEDMEQLLACKDMIEISLEFDNMLEIEFV